MSDNKISIKTLNLNQEFSEIKNQLKTIIYENINNYKFTQY